MNDDRSAILFGFETKAEQKQILTKHLKKKVRPYYFADRFEKKFRTLKVYKMNI